MTLCPSCRHSEPFGALFCSECGAQLLFLESAPAERSQPTVAFERKPPGVVQPKAVEAEPPPRTGALEGAESALRLIDSGQLLPLTEGDHTLGRSTGQQPILPDVDLTPFGAFEEGVSRLHATLKVKPGGAIVTDLGSVNGTRVNGKKLPAHLPQALEHGDVIQLGKLKLQILIRK
jgi:pSer/pThr/pTyr-binding forkhead associated (FHA) protein